MDILQHSSRLNLILVVVVASVVGCGTRPTSTRGTGTSAAQRADPLGDPEFGKMDTFVRGDARIALGQTKDDIRGQLSKGEVKSHKPYAFRKPEPDMFDRDVWILFYGPEMPGMGRVDELRVTFTNGKVTKLEGRVHFCP